MSLEKRAYHKCFTDYAHGVRECRGCNTLKPFAAFGLNKGVINSDCKKCKVKITVQRVKEKSLRERPHLFKQCDNDTCCNIWPKNNGDYCSKCGTKSYE